jgi:protein-S-isoprenylcysteine O-methyltransferase Ste14
MPWGFMIAGSTLVVTGTAVYVMALRTFNQGYNSHQLVTHGLYACVRHPIYFAWIVLICPGVVLFFQSWLMLILPLVAYGSFKLSIHREDRALEDRFGQAYQDYRARTPEFLPVLLSRRDQPRRETQ